MASLINSIRNISSDAWWVPKLLFYSYFVFLLFLNWGYLLKHPSAMIALFTLLCILFLGTAGIMMNRNINNYSPILPNIKDFPELMRKAVGIFVLMFPASIIYYFVNNYFQNNFYLEDSAHIIVTCMIILVFLPFILIPPVLYCARGKFIDGYRFDLIVQGAGNFIVASLGYVLQHVLILFVFFLLFHLAFLNMLGAENVAIIIWDAIYITITFFSIFSYCSDLYDEAIPKIKTENKDKESKNKKNPSPRPKS